MQPHLLPVCLGCFACRDLSHIAMDPWMIALQVVMLVVTLLAPMTDDQAYPMYLAYQLQVATMYILLGLQYLIAAFQYTTVVGDAVKGHRSSGNIAGAAQPAATSIGGSCTAAGAGAASAPTGSLRESRGLPSVDMIVNMEPGGACGSARGAEACGSEHTTGHLASPDATLERSCQPHAYISFALSALVIGLSFLLRAILFVYTPITSSRPPDGADVVLYPAFYYVVPEVITPLLALHLLLPDGLRKTLPKMCRRKADDGPPPAAPRPSAPLADGYTALTE